MEEFCHGINRRNTNAIKWDLQTNKQKENDLLPFRIADSDYKTYNKVIDDLCDRVKHGAFGYTFIDDEYYQIIKKWVKRRYHYDIDVDYIIPTHGVVTALDFLVSLLTKEKDKIVVSTPVYNPFYNVIVNNNRELVCNKLIEKDDSYFFDFDDLDKKLVGAKMYILCNPHNPIGRVWKKEELDRIVSLCKKHDCIIISDEIHCDIIMNNYELYSMGHYLNEYDKIAICTAPSKTFNIAGLMNANVICKNEEYRKLYKDYQDKLSLSTPNLLSLVACKSAYSTGDNWVDNQNKYLTENRDLVYKFIKENLPLAKTYKLEGTYLMWINLSYLGLEQDILLSNLLKANIQVNSGIVYSSDYKGYIRFNIATSRENLLEGLKRLKKAVE